MRMDQLRLLRMNMDIEQPVSISVIVGSMIRNITQSRNLEILLAIPTGELSPQSKRGHDTSRETSGVRPAGVTGPIATAET